MPHYKYIPHYNQTFPTRIEPDVKCAGIYNFMISNKEWIEKELDSKIKLESITDYNSGVFFTVSPNLKDETIFVYTSNIDHPEAYQKHCVIWKQQDISTSEAEVTEKIKSYRNSKIVQDTIINLYNAHKRNEKLNQLI